MWLLPTRRRRRKRAKKKGLYCIETITFSNYNPQELALFGGQLLKEGEKKSPISWSPLGCCFFLSLHKGRLLQLFSYAQQGVKKAHTKTTSTLLPLYARLMVRVGK